MRRRRRNRRLQKSCCRNSVAFGPEQEPTVLASEGRAREPAERTVVYMSSWLSSYCGRKSRRQRSEPRWLARDRVFDKFSRSPPQLAALMDTKIFGRTQLLLKRAIPQ